MRLFLLITGLALACSGCGPAGSNPDYGYGSDYAYRSSYPSGYYPSGYQYSYGTYAAPTYGYSYGYSSYPSYTYSAPYNGYASGPGFSFGFSSGGVSHQ